MCGHRPMPWSQDRDGKGDFRRFAGEGGGGPERLASTANQSEADEQWNAPIPGRDTNRGVPDVEMSKAGARSRSDPRASAP